MEISLNNESLQQLLLEGRSLNTEERQRLDKLLESLHCEASINGGDDVASGLNVVDLLNLRDTFELREMEENSQSTYQPFRPFIPYHITTSPHPLSLQPSPLPEPISLSEPVPASPVPGLFLLRAPSYFCSRPNATLIN